MYLLANSIGFASITPIYSDRFVPQQTLRERYVSLPKLMSPRLTEAKLMGHPATSILSRCAPKKLIKCGKQGCNKDAGESQQFEEHPCNEINPQDPSSPRRGECRSGWTTVEGPRTVLLGPTDYCPEHGAEEYPSQYGDFDDMISRTSWAEAKTGKQEDREAKQTDQTTPPRTVSSWLELGSLGIASMERAPSM
jgi:hypothetical protein